MIRTSLVVTITIGLLLMCAAAPAQTKAPAPATAKSLSMKPLDINTASEEEIVAVGLDRATAKKLVESRPYRNKTELVSRKVLTRDQYNKVKDAIVAKQPPKTSGR